MSILSHIQKKVDVAVIKTYIHEAVVEEKAKEGGAHPGLLLDGGMDGRPHRLKKFRTRF